MIYILEYIMSLEATDRPITVAVDEDEAAEVLVTHTQQRLHRRMEDVQGGLDHLVVPAVALLPWAREVQADGLLRRRHVVVVFETFDVRLPQDPSYCAHTP